MARIRPLLAQELEKDTIVEAASASGALASPSIVRIPNPKNEAEAYSFQFNSVYDQEATQQTVFDDESKASWSRLVLVIADAYGSRSYGQASLQGIRCHSFCIWSHRHGQDAYNAGRKDSCGAGCNPKTAERDIPSQSQDGEGFCGRDASGGYKELLRDLL